MKKLTAAVVLVASLGILAGTANAQQSTATASGVTATADIVAAIAISKTANLNFGQVVAGAALGTVVMAPAGTRSSTGGTTLANSTGSNAAAFTVTGNGSDTYAITLPSTDVTLTSGGNTMPVNTFTSTPSGTGTLSSGTQNLTVGATLNVGAVQVAGAYTGTFDVTVAYN